MSTVKDIYNYIDKIAPFVNQEDYDNSSINIGWGDDDVKSALIALDATTDVVRDAEQIGAQLIITHHPVLFHSIKQISFKSVAGRLAFDGINVISAHTSFDSAKMNDILCDKLNLIPTEPLRVDNGVPIGYICECANMTPERLVTRIQSALGTTCVRYNNMGGEINRTAVCAGSGGEFLKDVIDKKVDCLITGDVKHNVFIDAYNAGVMVIDAGHYHTEEIFCDYMKNILTEKFPDVHFDIAPSQRDILSYQF